MMQPRPEFMGPEPPRTEPAWDATQAFDALVREHYGRLCGFAFRLLGSREQAEDVVHDVLLRVWRERDRFEFRDPLAYLYRSVRNRIISDRRRQAVRTRLAEELRESDALITREPGAAAALEGHDLAAAAARAVESLPERCRLVFTMRREQGLSYAEIARILDISEKTVENQMTRAAKLLRARLAQYLSLLLAVVTTAA